MKVLMKKVSEKAIPLKLGSTGAAAYDVCYAGEYSVFLQSGGVHKCPTGWAFELPEGTAMLILPRSGLATNDRLRPANTPGLLDHDYRGELFVALENFGKIGQTIEPGQRIAQVMIVHAPRMQMLEVSDLSSTERGNGAFGSTGR